jgi:LmbE family N-acetylglucosaminyl deacetylase
MNTQEEKILNQYLKIIDNKKSSKHSKSKLNKNILLIPAHPDDEVMIGSLALRLKMEHACNIYVLPYSFGSLKKRQAQRKKELSKACLILGFTLLERDNLAPLLMTELNQRLKQMNFDLIITHHQKDGHPTHMSCAKLVMKSTQKFKLPVVVADYWAPNFLANFFVEISTDHLKILYRALVCHQGEIKRNPYHKSYPAFLINNYRLASESVGQFGQSARLSLGQFYQLTFSNKSLQFADLKSELKFLFT